MKTIRYTIKNKKETFYRCGSCGLMWGDTSHESCPACGEKAEGVTEVHLSGNEDPSRILGQDWLNENPPKGREETATVYLVAVNKYKPGDFALDKRIVFASFDADDAHWEASKLTDDHEVIEVPLDKKCDIEVALYIE